MQLLCSLDVLYCWQFCHQLWPCIQNIHTLFDRTSTKRIHITSLPRSGLKSYAGSQIHKRDAGFSRNPQVLELLVNYVKWWRQSMGYDWGLPWACAKWVSLELRHEFRYCETAKEMTSNNLSVTGYEPCAGWPTQ